MFRSILFKVNKLEEIEVGNLFIQGGFPGHGIIVLELAENDKGHRVFLLAQSYMPAQDMHILNSPFKYSPWYDINFGEHLQTPEWTFTKNDLHRFK